MLHHKQLILAVAMACVAVAAAGAMAQHHHHEGDFIIGIGGGAAPQLKFEFDPHMLSGEECIELSPSVNPAVAGWLSTMPGFDALEADEPDEDFYRLGSGAQIRLVGVDLDPALFVRASSLGTPVRISPSPVLGFLDLGGEELHVHPVWHIDSSAPGFDPSQTSWSGTFKFVDVGTTGYADSDPFTLCFVPVPEPTAAGLLALGGWVLTLARPRRRR